MLKKILITLCLLLIASTLIAAVLLNRMGIKPALWLSSMPESSEFSSTQSSNTISIRLDKKLEGFSQITDFQFFPNSDSQLLLLQKSGELFQVDIERNTRQLLATLDVLTQSEQGLLGVAIHPDYPKIPCIYLNAVIEKQQQDTSQVSEWCVDEDNKTSRWYQNKVLLEVSQPYKNHNAGHLIFDKQGLLYIPWGDGGSGGDPQGHAQNLQSLLGKILRINPEAFNTELAYSIPEDNPFVDSPDVPDEIYAYGLRNPWKLSFDPKGRLIAADVGQNKWEEIGFIEAGGNHGWNDIEALHCYKTECDGKDTVLPFIEYGHDLGRSVTGGYVYLAEEIPALHNKYVFGDFVSGQLWAADLPEDKIQATINAASEAKTYTQVYQLGHWPLLISTFARDHSGHIYVADFARGHIYKIAPAKHDK